MYSLRYMQRIYATFWGHMYAAGMSLKTNLHLFQHAFESAVANTITKPKQPSLKLMRAYISDGPHFIQSACFIHLTRNVLVFMLRVL